MNLAEDACRDGLARGPVFPLLRRDPLNAQVLDPIRSLIVAGELLPGQTLPPERELAAMFGVSRALLRELLRGLAALNVLEARDGVQTLG